MKTIKEAKLDIEIKEGVISILKDKYQKAGKRISELELELFQRRGILIEVVLRELTKDGQKFFIKKGVKSEHPLAILRIDSVEIKEHFINLFGVTIRFHPKEQEFLIRQLEQIYLEDYGKTYELIPISEEQFKRNFELAIKCTVEGIKINSDYSFENELL